MVGGLLINSFITSPTNCLFVYHKHVYLYIINTAYNKVLSEKESNESFRKKIKQFVITNGK